MSGTPVNIANDPPNAFKAGRRGELLVDHGTGLLKGDNLGGEPSQTILRH